MIDVINDENVDGSLAGFEFQTELFFDGRKNRRGAVRRRCGGVYPEY
jgi:hypothetical protein